MLKDFELSVYLHNIYSDQTQSELDSIARSIANFFFAKTH